MGAPLVKAFFSHSCFDSTELVAGPIP